MRDTIQIEVVAIDNSNALVSGARVLSCRAPYIRVVSNSTIEFGGVVYTVNRVHWPIKQGRMIPQVQVRAPASDPELTEFVNAWNAGVTESERTMK